MDILPIHEVSSDSYFVLASRLHSHEPRGPRRPPDTERANPPAEPCGERGERAAPPGFSRFLRAVAESCMSWYNDSTYMYTLPGVYTQVGAFMLSAGSEYAVTSDVIPLFKRLILLKSLLDTSIHLIVVSRWMPRQLRVANSVQLAKCHGHSSLYSYTPGWHFTTHTVSQEAGLATRSRSRVVCTQIATYVDCSRHRLPRSECTVPPSGSYRPAPSSSPLSSSLTLDAFLSSDPPRSLSDGVAARQPGSILAEPRTE